MAQLKDNCFINDGELITTYSVNKILFNRLNTVVDKEITNLRDASGRILAENIISQVDVPPHNNSAVDGFAVYFDDLSSTSETQLKIVGKSAAGHPYLELLERGQAIKIFTGAPMPKGKNGGPDTIFMQEDCKTEFISKMEIVIVPPGIKKGANRRLRGEDVTKGNNILEMGALLRAQEIGLAASTGLTSIGVYKKLKVAILSTGDEVYDPGSELPYGGIFDSNRYSLFALLKSLGCNVTDLGIAPDNKILIRKIIEKASKSHDVIMTTAGMSVGEEDHIYEVISTLGEIYFWKVAIKPGRPVALGQVKNTTFIGLPGNPAAMMVTFLRVARPALLRLSGARLVEPRTFKVLIGFEHHKKPGRREYLRVSLSNDGDGNLVANKFPREGAGILTSLVESEGFVELSEDVTHFEERTLVDYLPFSEVGL
ncbi:MAG: molybdopterin molybdotransferase MoeA [Alphaproteobacteria bacterium]|nr:molybdopterin molybdotransferase MoeA [Alphaproteobacteria bacterium]